jgi:acyl dehydratase
MHVGIGLDELRWQRPVHSGDTLRVDVEIVAKA